MDVPIFLQELDSSTCYQEALSNIDVVVHVAAKAHVGAERTDSALHEYRRLNTEATIGLAKQAVEAGVAVSSLSTIKFLEKALCRKTLSHINHL